MSVELRYLAYTAFLTAALWIPYIISQVQTNGFLTPANYVDPTPRKVPLWGMRANRAHSTRSRPSRRSRRSFSSPMSRARRTR